VQRAAGRLYEGRQDRMAAAARPRPTCPRRNRECTQPDKRETDVQI